MNLRKCYPEGRRKAVTLSYDDGVTYDEHLIAIMKQYGLKGTFNLNSAVGPNDRVGKRGDAVVRRMDPAVMPPIYKNQEVACHSAHHPHLESLSEREVYEELFFDRKTLEERFRRKITGLALPYGSWNDMIYQVIRNLGFSYNRTARSTHDFRVPEDFLRWDGTCHHGDPELFPLLEAFLETEEELALFYLWGHSFEFEGDRTWNLIEAFAQKISGKEDVWYATNGEICAYLTAMKRLVTGDGFLLNPTEIPLWVELDDVSRQLLPGQWLNL